MSENEELSQLLSTDSYESVPVHYGNDSHTLPQEEQLLPYTENAPGPSAPFPQAPRKPYTALPSTYAPAPQSFGSQERSSSSTPQVSASTTQPQEQSYEPSKVTEALLTDVEKHLPPATEPQFIPPLKPDVIVPQYDVTSTDPHTQHPPPVTTQPRIVGPPQETSLLESNADGIFFLSICLCIICCLFGSPLTVACFIPAIYVSAKIKDHAGYGNNFQAQSACVFVLVFNSVGVVFGFMVQAVFVVLILT